MPQDEQAFKPFQVQIGPQTVVVTLNLGGPYLVLPFNHEDVLAWASEIRRQQRAKQAAEPLPLLIKGR